MNDNPQLLAAVLDLTKSVSEIKTTLIQEIGSIRKELTAVHQEFRDEIRVINTAIDKEREITSVVRPLVEIWERKKAFVLGSAFVLMLTGASFYGLMVERFNEATGVSQIEEAVKKNTSVLKDLSAFHGILIE
jgi:hypothetical protein